MGRTMRRLLRAASVFFTLAAAQCLTPAPALATVTSTTRSVEYTGSGGRTFTVPFPFVSKLHLRVKKTTIATSAVVTLTQGVDYVVTLPPSGNGTVTTTLAVTSSYRLKIERVVPYTQLTSFITQGSYEASAHERVADLLEMQIQQLIGSVAVDADVTAAIATHEGSADPHTGYMLLAGRSGGQHAYGGTGAGDSLWLTPSSNATHGLLKMGTNGTELVVDDVTGFVGIGTATPAYMLDVQGDVAFGTTPRLLLGSEYVSSNSDDTGAEFGVYAADSSGIVVASSYLLLYGPSHATKPGDADLDGRVVRIRGAGGGTTRATFDSTGLTLGTGMDLTVAGEVVGVAATANTAGATFTGTGTGSGVDALSSSGTGYALKATADTTTPVRAALHLEPQDTDPSTPAQGNVYVNSGDGTLRTYNGSRWVRGGIVSSVRLTSDVTDSTGASTFTDCTGLSFTVASGTTYDFRATIIYDAAATTTGAGWSVNGPAFTRLGFKTVIGLTTTTDATTYNTAYDAPVAPASSPLTVGNVATITGTVTPSANGTLVVRFATEVDTSAVTCKTGSLLEWWTP